MEEKKNKKLDWEQFIGKLVNVTMYENYGVVYNEKNSENPMFFEIVFKSGTLIDYYDDALLLEAVRENQTLQIYIPIKSVKCIEIFQVS